MNKSSIQPRLIVHGGAGAISRANLTPEAYARYASKLRSVNAETLRLLHDGATALDAATHAVRLLEDCPLFNCGKGAVFTRDGTIELEASVSGGFVFSLIFFCWGFLVESTCTIKSFRKGIKSRR